MINKFINKLSTQEKKIFYITAAFVLLAFVDRLLLGPFIDKISLINDKIEMKKDSVKRDLRILSYKDRILEEKEVFAGYFTEKVPDQDVISAEFLSVVERLATESKVNLVKSNPSETITQKRFIEFYADLDCSGDLKDVVSFMHAINSTDELLKVVTFTMTPKRGTEAKVNSSMKIVKLIINEDMINEPSSK